MRSRIPTFFSAVALVAEASDTCSTPGFDRVDCQPNVQSLTQQQCESSGCCWQPALEFDKDFSIGQPWCFHRRDTGYSLSGLSLKDHHWEGTLARKQPTAGEKLSPFGGDIETLHLDIWCETKTSVRVRITDPSKERFEVPIPPPTFGDSVVDPRDADIDVVFSEASQPFSIDVRRKSDGASLFNTTDVGALVYADQYLQWSTRLSSSTLYGLGEHALPLNIADAASSGSTGEGRSDVAETYQQLEMFARDQAAGSAPFSNTNLYGDHPFYVNFDNDADGTAHGVFLLNSNAMEMSLQGAGGQKQGRILTYRTIGGIIDLRVFSGPSPADVVRQYTDVVGKPYMPPYWALGFHLCRWGYENATRTKEVTDNMIAAGIPMDTQWNDIDYMDRHLDWSFDGSKFAELPKMVEDLHAKGMHYVMIIDPGISSEQAPGTYAAWDDGLEQNVFIQRADGSPLIGQVWPGKTGYTDFFHPNATSYWRDSMAAFHAQIPFDGMWVDMNEVSNFVAGDEKGCPTDGPDGALENPPYVPLILDRDLKSKTICMSATQVYPPYSPTGRTAVYNTHNLYGYSEMISTMAALKEVRPGKRQLVISRSTFPNSGVHGGHWLGDNTASWDDLALSIPGSLTFNIFGIPLVGSDICGFGGTTTVELCTRWMQLGAFFPFSRNHNTIGSPDQDPPSLGEPVVSASRDALLTRYELLPFLYTLFFLANRDGDTVMRPLSFEFPADPRFRSADKQFFWGSALLVTPVLEEGATEVTALVPEARWFSYYTGEELPGHGEAIFDAPLAGPINLHVRGGSVIPTQQPNTQPPITTVASRSQPFGLTVAMDVNGEASGMMYLDDGESLNAIDSEHYQLLKITAHGEKSIQAEQVGGSIKDGGEVLGSLRVFGINAEVSEVKIAGSVLDRSKWNCDARVLTLQDLSVPLSAAFPITWEFEAVATLV